ncbi:hypothetical protein ACFE04_019538 [Oxalis oulophora]
MGKNGRPKMGSNKETPHSASTSYLRIVRSKKCVLLRWSNRKIKFSFISDKLEVPIDVVGETSMENPRDRETMPIPNVITIPLPMATMMTKMTLMISNLMTIPVPNVIKISVPMNVPSPPSENLRGKNASKRWHIFKKRAIIKEVNIQQLHYVSFDRTVPLEKAGLMKSFTQMESFRLG